MNSDLQIPPTGHDHLTRFTSKPDQKHVKAGRWIKNHQLRQVIGSQGVLGKLPWWVNCTLQGRAVTSSWLVSTFGLLAVLFRLLLRLMLTVASDLER